MKREEKKKNTVPGDPLLKGDEAREDEVTHEQLQARQHTVVEDARWTCMHKLGLGESWLGENKCNHRLNLFLPPRSSFLHDMGSTFCSCQEAKKKQQRGQKETHCLFQLHCLCCHSLYSRSMMYTPCCSCLLMSIGSWGNKQLRKAGERTDRKPFRALWMCTCLHYGVFPPKRCSFCLFSPHSVNHCHNANVTVQQLNKTEEGWLYVYCALE